MGYKLTWVYIRPNGTEQKIRPTGWQPWANTVAYYPFNTDFNDYSWNWFDLTNNWWVAIESVGWVTCANFKDQSPYWLSRSTWNIITAWPYTYLCRINRTWWWPYNPRIFWWNNEWWMLYIVSWGKYSVEYPNYWWWIPDSSWRHLICFTWNMSTWEFSSYKDWSFIASWTSSVRWARTWLVIWTTEWNYSLSDDRFIWQMSNVIFENKQRTAQEISDYYDQTKWDYWIS